MHIIRPVDQLQAEINRLKSKGKSIGFVPTLGALHAGHASLFNKAKKSCDVVVVSIFVNPTQFNEASDLEKYPRTLGRDIEVLLSEEVDLLFYPHNEGVYPPGLNTHVDIDLDQLDKVMEGAERPGHFEGVMQVVNRLLDIVKPDALFMGQKDLQQHTIIAHMIETLDLPLELVVCPTMREESGLAMSSRNARLTKEGKIKAAEIHQTLQGIKENYSLENAHELQKSAMDTLSRDPFKAEYISIVDGKDLLSVINHPNPSGTVAVCCAVWLEGVRLIDNVVIH